MSSLYYKTLIIVLFFSCNNRRSIFSEDNPNSRESNEPVKFSFYPDSHLDTASDLRTDGYYIVRDIFGSMTTNGKDYYPMEPTYGCLVFFNDGFCRVGKWNGWYKFPEEIKNNIEKDGPYGYLGIYKINADTLYLEYLYTPGNQGTGPQHKEIVPLVGLIKKDAVIVTHHYGRKYSYPEVEEDSLTSSCVGRFVSYPIDYSREDNHLKSDTVYFK